MRGRPPKTLLKRVKVRLQNKGNLSKKKTGVHEKYEAPHNEHPQTNQNISNSDVHANHVEALNAAIRRKNSAYRRKTNTYAKSTKSLQKTLDIYWVAHNFVVNTLRLDKFLRKRLVPLAKCCYFCKEKTRSSFPRRRESSVFWCSRMQWRSGFPPSRE